MTQLLLPQDGRKLETNETYYGSDGVSTGPATVYVMCTGHNADCEKGEAVSEDGSNELSWRNSNVATNTSNLITVVTLNGTTGGFLTGSGDLVNAGGYAVTSVDCSGTGDVKGIPVDDLLCDCRCYQDSNHCETHQQ